VGKEVERFLTEGNRRFRGRFLRNFAVKAATGNAEYLLAFLEAHKWIKPDTEMAHWGLAARRLDKGGTAHYN